MPPDQIEAFSKLTAAAQNAAALAPLINVAQDVGAPSGNLRALLCRTVADADALDALLCPAVPAPV